MMGPGQTLRVDHEHKRVSHTRNAVDVLDVIAHCLALGGVDVVGVREVRFVDPDGSRHLRAVEVTGADEQDRSPTIPNDGVVIRPVGGLNDRAC